MLHSYAVAFLAMTIIVGNMSKAQIGGPDVPIAAPEIYAALVTLTGSGMQAGIVNMVNNPCRHLPSIILHLFELLCQCLRSFTKLQRGLGHD